MGRDRLKVLVYPHDMAMGGSQLNAIELAAAVGELGHSVAVVGDDGTGTDGIDGNVVGAGRASPGDSHRSRKHRNVDFHQTPQIIRT